MSSRIIGVVCAALVVIAGVGMAAGASVDSTMFGPATRPGTTVASPVGDSGAGVADPAAQTGASASYSTSLPDTAPTVSATAPLATSDTASDTASPTTSPTASDTNAGLGVEISGFLRASATEIGGDVESGMWVAQFERASNLSQKQQALKRRTTVLDRRLQRIEARADHLFADEKNHSLVRETQQAELAGRLRALRAATADAKTAATSAGVKAGEIKALQAKANDFTLPPTVVTFERRRGVESMVSEAT